MTRPAEKMWFLPTFRRTSKIWIASSRVGERMRAPRPSYSVHRFRYRFSRTGSKKARVFPEPVLAAPRMSLDFKAAGIARDWIVVRVLKWDLDSPDCVACERGSSANRVGGVVGRDSESATRLLNSSTLSSSRFLFKLFGCVRTEFELPCLEER